jgi:glycosyltransferase involved in cell wall biosynthesis
VKQLGIPTCNRPEALQECLGSFLNKSQQIERVLILDDSKTESAVAANRAAIASIQSNQRPTVEHITGKEKNTTIQSLLEAIDRSSAASALHFALFGDPRLQGVRGAGCNRNAGLLLCAGDQLVSIDDDARYSFSRITALGEATDESARCLPEAEFRQLYVNGAVDSEKRIDALTEPWRNDGASELLSILSTSFSKRPGETGRVRLAMSGIAGNRWYDRPEAISYNEGLLRDEIYRKKRRYRAARHSGLAIMQAPAATVTDATFFVTCFSAMDATEILPPFPPAGHADDTLFSLVMNGCYPSDLIAHHPFVVHHDLGPRRPVRDEDFYRKGAPFDLMTGTLIREAAAIPQTDSAEQAMRLIGRRMRALAELSHKEWVEYSYDLWLDRIAQTVEGLERRLDRYNAKPAFWARDVEDHIRFLRGATGDPSTAIPRELLAEYSIEMATALHRDFFRSYGELLTVWPEIWHAAKALNEDSKEVTY